MASSSERLFSRVRFRVKAEVRMGETIYVVGSHALLGEWDKTKAVQLFTSPEAYPTWFHVDTIALPTHVAVEYRYMVMSGGNFQRYEDGETPRRITPQGYEFVVDDILDKGHSKPAAKSRNDVASSTGESDGGDSAGIGKRPSVATSGSQSLAQSADDASPRGEDGSALAHSTSETDTPTGAAGEKRSTAGAAAPPSSRTRGEAGPASEVMGHGKKSRGVHHRGGNKAQREQPGKRLAGREGDVQLTDADGVVVVVPHLPVMLSHYSNGAWRVSWDEEHLLSQKKPSVHFGGEMKLRVTFVGIPNVHVPEEEQEAVRAALAPFRCKPVFLPQDVKRDAVTGFCKDTLWPLFHNVVDVYGAVPTRWWNRARQSTRWQAYMEMNRRFADVVVEAYNEGDLVWIHDYHLLLLPSVLARRRLRSSNISLFLHAPFPSSEIFRTLSVRDDLLRGMLNADHIGFHLFEYARHFLACCRRILGLEHSIQGGGRIALHSHGRDVVITVCHAGIEPVFISHRLVTDEVRVFQEELSKLARLPKGHGSLIPTPTPTGVDDDRDELASPTPQPAMHTPSVDSAASTPNSVTTSHESCLPSDGELKVVVGLDSLERLKGLPLKLIAFERFLEENLEWLPHVRLLQFGVFDKSRDADCKETQGEVEFLVRRINARFGHLASGKRSGVKLTLPARAGGTAADHSSLASNTSALPPGGSGSIPPTASSEEHSSPQQPHPAVHSTSSHTDQECGSLLGPVVFYCRRQGGMSLSERLALYNLGNVYYSSAFRDGLNLSPLEYVHASERTQGVVVVSEFSSCSRMLPGAIRINPWKVSAAANAIARAVSMHTGEATARRQANLACLGDNTTSLWAERVLLDLKRASQLGGHRTYMGYGLGLNFRQLGFESNFSALNVESMIAAYRRTSRRLFLLDYSGTLLSRAFKVDKVAATKQQAYAHGLLDDPSSAFLLSEPPLSAAVKASLRALASDPRNTVVILSGKERTVLETAFADCPELCLAAEHGFYYRFGVAPGPLTSSALPLGVLAAGAAAPHNTAREWLQLGEHFDDSWMDLVAAYMEGYAARTNGTYVSRKSSSMVWHFADADKEFGRLQAKELVDHLTNLLKHFPVEVFQGTAYIEVRPRGVSKGAISQHFVDLLEGRVQAGQATLMEQTGTTGAGAHAETAQAAAEAAVSCKLQRRHRGKGTTAAAAAASSRTGADGAGGDTDAPSTDAMDGDTTDAGTPRAGAAGLSILSPALTSRAGSESGGTGGKASVTPARRTKRVDFVLCVGDDNADESMFMMLGDRWKGLLAQRGRAKERRRGPLGSSLAFSGSTGRVGGDMREYTDGDGVDAANTPQSDNSTPGDSPAVSLQGLEVPLPAPGRHGSRGAGLSRSRSHGKHIGRRAQGLRASMGLGPVGFMEGSSVLRGDAAGSLASLSSAGSGGSQSQQAHKAAAMPHQYTVIVGKKPSAAQYYLDDTGAVEECLRALSKVATRINTNRSMTDLNSLAVTSSSTVPRLTFSSSHAALPALGLPQVPSYVDFASELGGPSLGSEAQPSSLVPRVLPLQISALPESPASATTASRPMLVSSMSLPLLQEAMFPPSPVPGRAHTAMYSSADVSQLDLPGGALGTAVPQLATGAAALPGARSGVLRSPLGDKRSSTQDNLVEFLGMDEDQPPAF